MSPATANFVFAAANFLLLAAALGFVLFKPVRRALDAERERHGMADKDEKRLRAEAEALAKDARAAREAADREIAETRAETLAAAQKQAAQILEEARKAQSAERGVFEEEAKASRNAQAAASTETVGRIAGESVARLLDALDGPSLDLALVRAACVEIRALPSFARGSAQVEAARPLDAESKRLLEAALGGAFAERTVEELGAGVRVTTSAGQVDATAASLARQAVRSVIDAAAGSAANARGADG